MPAGSGAGAGDAMMAGIAVGLAAGGRWAKPSGRRAATGAAMLLPPGIRRQPGPVRRGCSIPRPNPVAGG